MTLECRAYCQRSPMQDPVLLGEIGNRLDGLATNRPMPLVRPGHQHGASYGDLVHDFTISIRPPRIYIAWTLP
jgi:hypothetical protein